MTLKIPAFPPNELGARKLKRWLKINRASDEETATAIANHNRLVAYCVAKRASL